MEIDNKTMPPLSDMEILDKVKNAIVDQVNNGTIKLTIGDLMKVFEMQKSLTQDKDAEEKFWKYIEQVRQEELKDK